jgi:hypothetical protein
VRVDGEPLLVKGMEDSVHGIDVQREARGDFHSVPTGRVGQKDLSPATLGCGGIVSLEELLKLAELGRSGLTDGQGSRHE